MLSTPNGVGNVYHRIYEEALSGKNDFNPIRTEWWEHPEHISDLTTDANGKKTSSWFRKETKGLSEREIAQEYECEFLASGDTFFTPAVIEIVKNGVISDFGVEKGLHIFANPVPDMQYIITVDCASGKGSDDGGVHVFEIQEMEQVAELNQKMLPNEFAAAIYKLGMDYNKALMVVENNAVGLAVIEHLKMMAYPNFFYSKKGAKAGDRLGDPGNAAEGSMPSDYVHGVSTQGSNRPFMLSKLEELIRTGAVKFRSKRFVSEMETFIWNNGRPEARSGKHDDLIMAAAIGIWVRDNLYGSVYNTPELTKAMLNAMRVDKTVNTQVHGASKNPDHVPVRALGVFNTPPRPYIVKMPNGRYIDLMAEMGMFTPRKG